MEQMHRFKWNGVDIENVKWLGGEVKEVHINGHAIFSEWGCILNGGFGEDRDWIKYDGSSISGGVAIMPENSEIRQTFNPEVYGNNDIYRLYGNVINEVSDPRVEAGIFGGSNTEDSIDGGIIDILMAVNESPYTLYIKAKYGSFHLDNITFKLQSEY